MQNLWQDLRYGMRILLKKPGFMLVAVLTLALGIGATTAIFTVVNAVLLRPLPFPQSERLVMLWQGGQRAGDPMQLALSALEFLDYREQNRVFEGLAVSTNADVNMTGIGEPERMRGTVVSADWFTLLKTQPLLGRSFLPEEHEPGKNNSVVLSYGLWQRRFGAERTVVGQTLVLNGRPRTVVGVMPAGFRFPEEAQLWLPLALTPEQLSPGQRNRHFLTALARLKDGVPQAQAEAEVKAVAGRFPGGMNARLVGLREQLVGDVRLPLLVLLGAVLFVMLIACANVGNLLLTRASARQKELAIRMALGAGRRRLFRQLLTESMLLSLAGGALGLIFALWCVEAFAALGTEALPRAQEIGLDERVFGFALMLSMVTGLLCGMAPALQAARGNLSETLKAGGTDSAGIGRQRVRGVLVVAEMALALMLLVGAGLLVRSFIHLLGVNPGFRPVRVLTADLALPFARYGAPARQADFYQQLLARLTTLPGVEAAGAVSDLPLSGANADRSFTHEGVQPEEQRRSPPNADYRHCTPDYFRALGVPLLRGRVFAEQDAQGAPEVALINETLARRIWPGEDPVGKRLAFFSPQGLEPWRTIVGVVGDIKHRGLNAETRPEIYVPQFQTPTTTMTLVVRVAGDPRQQTAAVREAVKSLDQELPLFNVRTMEQLRAGSLAPQRLTLSLLGVFAGVALLLAALGVYGVIAHSVGQRTHEIGIRVALGAQTRDVLRLVLVQGLKLALIGVALGTLGALALGRLLRDLLFEVSATDPLTFVAVVFLLTTVSLLASWIPARRATRVDPMVALRCE